MSDETTVPGSGETSGETDSLQQESNVPVLGEPDGDPLGDESGVIDGDDGDA